MFADNCGHSNNMINFGGVLESIEKSQAKHAEGEWPKRDAVP